MSSKYPTPIEIAQIFHPLSQQGQQSQFFDHVSDDVNWTILGHSPMSRVYTSKSDFFANTLKVLSDRVLKQPLALKVINVFGGGDSNQATVEMDAIDGICKNGMTYDMHYCWVVQFDQNQKIVKVRAYLDTDLLNRALRENA